MSDYLPPEVLLDILKRLPVKSLLRFRIVSKLWYSLITNPNFICQHLLHTTLLTPPRALVRYCAQDPNRPSRWIEHYSLRFDNENSFDEYMKPEFPFKSSVSHFRIVGCCNGLLCLADHITGGKCNIHLWNPSVGKSVAVPFNGSGSYFTHFGFGFGFGFDELTNDYKVVAYMNPQDSGVQPRAEIYSLSSGIWREITTKGLRYALSFDAAATASLNGVTHWGAVDVGKVRSDPEREFIATFSFKDEVFGEMMLPEKGSMPHNCHRFLMIYQDSLAFVDVDDFDGRCWIWVMKSYGVLESWTLLFEIGAPCIFCWPIGFRMNGELLMVSMGGKLLMDRWRTSLVSCDPKSGQVKDLFVIKGSKHSKLVDNIENFVDSWYLGRYVESLVLLDRVARTPEHIGTSDNHSLRRRKRKGVEESENLNYEE